MENLRLDTLLERSVETCSHLDYSEKPNELGYQWD